MKKKLILGMALLWLSTILFGQEIEQKKEIFIDEFESMELSSEWQWETSLIGNSYDCKTNPGFLTITAPIHVGMWGKNTTAPKLFIMVEKEWKTITTKLVDYQPTGEWQEAGLFIWQNDDNWFKIIKANDGKKEIVLAAGYIYGKERGSAGRECKKEDVWLRIEKEENKMLFQYSTDGKTFISIGRLAGGIVSEFSNPKIGLFAANGPNTVKFDFFKIE